MAQNQVRAAHTVFTHAREVRTKRSLSPGIYEPSNTAKARLLRAKREAAKAAEIVEGGRCRFCVHTENGSRGKMASQSKSQRIIFENR